MMVVMPYAHLLFEHHDCDHTAEHSKTCPFCKIMNTPAEASETHILVLNELFTDCVPEPVFQIPDVQHLPLHQARAPPFATV